MILVDHNTEEKLVQALVKIRNDAKSIRCLRFNIRGISESDARSCVLSSLERRTNTFDMQVFMCESGDIFVITPHMQTREVRECISDISTYLDRMVSQDWVSIIELPQQVNQLLVEVEGWLEKKRREEELRRKLHEAEQAERKRQAILNRNVPENSEDIAQRRRNRRTPELMIIEDDVFSRRLVESVLQKQYQLTGLGEASRAIETYARIAPDLLFLDINLPQVTGHELLEKIIALDPEAYVVMLSGNADRENIMQAMSKGAKGFIAKPFTKDKIFQYIEKCPTINRS